MEDALCPLDFDLMDELLLEGCLLEDPSCSEFLDSGFSPLLEIKHTSLNPNSPQENDQDDTESSVFPDNPPPVETQIENIVRTQSIFQNTTETGECSGQLECYLAAEVYSDEFETVDPICELNGKWGIEPSANPGSVSSVEERLTLALRYMKESMEDGHVLIQIWVPIKKGDKYVLSTCGQPYWLNVNCQRLVNYRAVSMNYQFSAEEDSDEEAGLPGRVFMGKLPEWTPDVRYFSSKEYPRVNHAQHYEVGGTVALPIFEQGSQCCLGVVEVMMTTQKIDYRPELANICNALQAVNLRSSEVMSTPNVKVNYDSYQDALMEILEVVRTACETHRLPLAQTWIPCIRQGKKSNRHSDENYTDCVSTMDAACYTTDPLIWGYHEACSNHHLFRGQGVVGKAFTTNEPCFSTDITAFSQTEYPLSHYARMFGLRAAVAIRLRSIYNAFLDYVLEFFLPVDCIDSEEQKVMLGSMSVTIQRVCLSLRVITDKELEDETILRACEVVPSNGLLTKSFASEDGRPNRENMPKVVVTPAIESSVEGSSLMIAGEVWDERKGKGKLFPASLPLFPKQEMEKFSVRTHWDNPDEVIHVGIIFPEFKQHHQDSAKYSVDLQDSFGKCSLSTAYKVKKRRTNIEKSVSLQVLRQHFAESLKDAAKSIGVCPTTLKRICRQHGINRWPSRKIKKVDHSLRKLQLVIDSVKGAERAFHINHRLYATFPEVHTSDLTSPNLSGLSTFSPVRQKDNPKSLYTHPSCSRSSNSSLDFSVGTPQQSHASVMDNKSPELERVYKEAEMCALNCVESKPPVRSNCHKSLKSSSVARDSRLLRVKAMYGEEKVRFILEPSWGFQDLRQEIAKRFNIENATTLDLKYLDDDLDWVLLTCDADLQECTDIHKLCATHTIKLMIHHILPRNECYHSSYNYANA